MLSQEVACGSDSALFKNVLVSTNLSESHTDLFEYNARNMQYISNLLPYLERHVKLEKSASVKKTLIGTEVG